MDDQDQGWHLADPRQGPHPVPVTPSRETERPAGLAFDVERRRGARSPSRGPDFQEPMSRTGAGDGGRRGLALPRDPARKEEQTGQEGHRP